MSSNPLSRLAAAASETAAAHRGRALPADIALLADEVVDALRVASGLPAEPTARERARVPYKVPTRQAPRVAGGSEPFGRSRIRRVEGGEDLASLDEMAEYVAGQARSMQLRDGEVRPLVSFNYADSYPDDRRMRDGDNGEALGRLRVASGGVPGPAEPRYTELTHGQATRPLRDGLPKILMPRGQLIYNQPLTLDDIVTGGGEGAATGIHTNEQDIAAATKSVQDFTDAPTQVTTTTRAVFSRARIGNFADRTNPEHIRSVFQLVATAHARQAETEVLKDINAGSTLLGNPAVYGAYRDLKRQVLAVVEEMRDHLRDDAVTLTAIFPDFLPAMLAADMVAQAPGDEAYQLTAASMRADIASWGVSPIFADDSIRGRTLVSPSPGGRTAGFDADVEWAIFPAGTFVFGDTGQLDLGLIRDSAMSQTNDAEMFYESFEAVPMLGNLSYWITSQLCSDGASQAPAAIGTCSPQGS
jgi:hypothetical protein